jgi:hypothetical protein
MERPVEAFTTIGVAFARARQVLQTDPGAVFTDTYTTEERRARRFQSDVSLALSAGASMHQEVTIQLGIAHSTEPAYVQPLTWHANGHERFLPAFDGALEISEAREGTGLRLVGSYTVPLGVAGRFGDGVIGQRLARRSLEMLVEWFGRRLENEVLRRLETADGHVRRLPTPVGDYEHSELYVG